MARRSTPDVWSAVESYVAQCYARGGSPDLARTQRSILRRFARHVNNCQVGSLTPDHVEDFFYGPKGLTHSCAFSTLGKYRADLKGFLAWCFRRSWCDDPERMLAGVIHTSTLSRRERLRLTEEQMWRMVESARDPRDAAMLVFAMHTGCRISEMVALRVRDLRLESGEIRVHVIKTKEWDVMRVSPLLDRHLREWLTIYTAAHNPPGDAFLFPARTRSTLAGSRHAPDPHRGYQPHGRITSPGRGIKQMAEDAGVELEKGDAWHTVRRSVARIYFDKASSLGHDAALRMTAAFLHHKNTKTTEIYLGLLLERVKRDQVMAEGFLTEPNAENVTRLADYREV